MHASKTYHLTNLKRSLLGCLGGALVATPAMADAPIQLTDGSADVYISPDTASGVYDWVVSGQDHLEQEWWWLETGGVRLSLDELTLSGTSMPLANKAVTTYTNATVGYSVQVTYELTGGDFASGQSLLKEAVSIVNHTGSALEISLFLYSDFDLGGTAGDDEASLLGMNDDDFPFGTTVGWFQAYQSDSGNSQRTIINGKPLLGELGTGTSLVDKLNNTTLALDSSAGVVLPLTAGATELAEFGPVGPDDVAYAFQWDFNIANGDSAGVGVDKQLDVTPIPEPTTAVLGLLGLAALCRARSRRIARP